MTNDACLNCGSVDLLPLENGLTGSRCSNCGSEHRFVVLLDTAQAHESIRIVGRDEHGKKEFDHTTGDDLFRLTGEWDELERRKDWKNDRYYEHIEDSEGNVKRHVDEPLSQHVPNAVKQRRD